MISPAQKALLKLLMTHMNFNDCITIRKSHKIKSNKDFKLFQYMKQEGHGYHLHYKNDKNYILQMLTSHAFLCDGHK